MKTLGIILFVLLCLVQLAVPSKMVFAQEDVLNTGHEYRFRTAPVDPYDPFRGKYVTLRFDAEEYETDSTQTWTRGEAAYVVLGTDSAGYAIVTSVQKQEPQSDVDYVLAEIQYVYEGRIHLNYSFDRFYMDENKAPVAETQYGEANRSFVKEAYAVVYIKKGEAALKDVMIDGVSLRVLAAQPVE